MLETDLNKHDQYSRRNNLDIKGIPGSVSDDQLEKKIIEIFNQINVKINKFDIEECHHMGKQPQEVIFSKRGQKLFHPTVLFNNIPVQHSTIQKHLGVYLDEKL